MQPLVTPGSKFEQVGRLLIAALVVISLPAMPLGNYLTYPFVILTTWFHEMGHGLTAIALGQHFEQLAIYPNGSGIARYSTQADLSPFSSAMISAGGPLAPTFIGALLIMASAHQRIWRAVLWAVVVALFASTILYVRSTVGYAVLPLIALTLAVIAWRAPAGMVRFTLQFLGLLGAMSMISDWRYLFTHNVVIDGRRMLSDTGQMEAALWLPYWLWAVVLIALSAAMVLGSFAYALSDKRQGYGKLPAPAVRFGRKKRKKGDLPKNVLQFRRLDDDDER